MAIPQQFIQDLNQRADVVEVVGRFVQLKKAGANYLGLCPFHGEKTPSFTVSPAKQFFHCFGCGKNGSPLGFLMEHLGLSFVEGVKELAGQYNLTVPEERCSPLQRAQEAARREAQSSLTELLMRAAKAYIKALKDDQRAIAYLQKRGLSGEIAKRYGLGYAPPGWRFLAGVFPDYAEKQLEVAGLVKEKTDEAGLERTTTAQRLTKTTNSNDELQRYDRFRDRVMFPIRNVKGQVIGFGGRVLDSGEPKYLNSPETPVFSKGQELYGLFEGRADIAKAGYALVCEGYMDVVALAQLGFGHAVASLGTACTPEHIAKLLRYTTHIVFSFDGDKAGRAAAGKALVNSLPLATDARTLRFLFLPAEHDPDSYIREHGADAFAAAVTAAQPLSQFLVHTARQGCDLATAEGRARLATQAKPLWQALPEGTLKMQILGELANLIALDKRELAGLWQQTSNGWQASGNTQGRGANERYPRSNTSERGAHAGDGRFEPSKGRFTQTAGTYGKGNEGLGRRNSITDAHYETASWGGFHPDAFATGPRSLQREDHALRLLLQNTALLEHLSAQSLALLGSYQGECGALFRWLEVQYHESGAQPWAQLKTVLQDPYLLAYATRLQGLNAELNADLKAPETTEKKAKEKTGGKAVVQIAPKRDPKDAAKDLEDIVLRVGLENAKAYTAAVAQRVGIDPSALAELKAAREAEEALQTALIKHV